MIQSKSKEACKLWIDSLPYSERHKYFIAEFTDRDTNTLFYRVLQYHPTVAPTPQQWEKLKREFL